MHSFCRLIPLIFLLAGCAAQMPAVTHYEQPPNPGGRMCAAQCKEAMSYAREGCKLKQRACTNTMQEQAIKDYELYTSDQFKARQPVELRPRDFERPETCVPAACQDAMHAKYDRCFEDCGGHIVSGAAPAPETAGGAE